jgi:hypothetical protein
LVLDTKSFRLSYLFVMKPNILLFVALGLAGVRAAPVPQTQALTSNDCDDKFDLRECGLVRRVDDELSSQIEDLSTRKPGSAERNRANMDKANERARQKRAFAAQHPDTPEGKRRRANLDKINERLREQRAFATQHPDTQETKLWRANMDKISERVREQRVFAKQHPESPEGKRLIANLVKKTEHDRAKAAVARQTPEETKAQRERWSARKQRSLKKLKALADASPREAERQREIRAAIVRRYLANKRAKNSEQAELGRAAPKKRYADRQAQTQPLVTDTAGPSAAEAAPFASELAKEKPQRQRPAQPLAHTQPFVTDPVDSSTQWAVSPATQNLERQDGVLYDVPVQIACPHHPYVGYATPSTSRPRGAACCWQSSRAL